MKPRARDLGIVFDGTPGALNAITDVSGVEVGHTTLVIGDGELRVGQGPVRTGVTTILPRGRQATERTVFAGWFSLNGAGEMTGTAWIDETGLLAGPLAITNTHSVGVVRDAIVRWRFARERRDPRAIWWALPLVAETYDGLLNDIHGMHVREEHVVSALDNAREGPVAEGNVGGGTGMVCFEFKGGVGTASRLVGRYTAGVLVQANFGKRAQLRIGGMPVGREPRCVRTDSVAADSGSIIGVVATDAPLLPHQMKRVARRAALGLARTGGIAADSSGDLFVAFSTANDAIREREENVLNTVSMLPDGRLTPLFEGVVAATEEAILNALTAAETMTGIDGRIVEAMPHECIRRMAAKSKLDRGGA